MACAYSKHVPNQAPALNALSQIANVGELCAGCRASIVADLTRLPGINNHAQTDFGGFLEDYIKIYVILSSPTIPAAKATMFGNSMIDGARKRGLSYHLKRYETRCRFPDRELIPTGVLGANEFYDMIARGVMWKDVGAGLGHGLYAHRLQWHVVLAVVTNDFANAKTPGWDHGGYDLFVSMGFEGRALNIWGKLFDASTTNCFRAPEFVEPNIGSKNIKDRIENKYQKYHQIFNTMRAYVGDVAGARANALVNSPANQALKAKGYPGQAGYEAARPGYLGLGAAQKAIDFELTNALWGCYYFARRGINAAIPADAASRSEYSRFAGVHEIKPTDRSDKFAADRVAIENNTIRLNSQIMPTSIEVTALREASGVSLAPWPPA